MARTGAALLFGIRSDDVSHSFGDSKGPHSGGPLGQDDWQTLAPNKPNPIGGASAQYTETARMSIQSSGGYRVYDALCASERRLYNINIGNKYHSNFRY